MYYKSKMRTIYRTLIVLYTYTPTTVNVKLYLDLLYYYSIQSENMLKLKSKYNLI